MSPERIGKRIAANGYLVVSATWCCLCLHSCTFPHASGSTWTSTQSSSLNKSHTQICEELCQLLFYKKQSCVLGLEETKPNEIPQQRMPFCHFVCNGSKWGSLKKWCQEGEIGRWENWRVRHLHPVESYEIVLPTLSCFLLISISLCSLCSLPASHGPKGL